MFYDYLKILCDKNNTTPTAVTLQLGMSKGSITNWKNGSIPNGDALVRFSEHFNVSTDYLLFGRERTYELTSEEEEWIQLLKQLPITERRELIGYAKGYVAALHKQPHSKSNKNMGKSSHSLHDNDSYETA